MGNTNLPQAGAADTENSRDTRSGDQQLTDEQRRRASQQGEAGRDKTSGSDSADDRDPDVDDGGKPAAERDVERPTKDDPYNPRNTTGAGDPPAVGQQHK